ncbi:PAS domain S-box protein [Aliiglaciecola sp. CAU 1673]|uniref:hybrid sensor histidine kinase/response regulator n=1 Tax=Aliiglaciecola sp. CAU 1673 TaxID=3032595 RepID=UPI0023DBCDC4|nr:PAS domain-containing sensor histidine kinase [Aliiglaciecola sp. CAU 1673]MDF2177089.1 PAS domain S-box protein [Aliiglaciecola sp. CAU 1673]
MLTKFFPLFEYSPVPMWLVDPQQQTILDVNLAAAELLGADKQVLQKEGMDDLMAADELQRFKSRIRSLTQPNSPIEREVLGIWEVNAHGRQKMVQIEVSRVPYEQEWLLLLVATDVSAKVEAEQAALGLIQELGLERLKLQQVLNSMTTAVIIIDEKGIVESCNPSTEKIFGYPPEAVIGKNVNALMPEPHHSDHNGYLEAYLTTGVAKIIGKPRELTALHKDGHTFPILLSIAELPEGKEGKRRFMGSCEDLTQLKLHEKQLALSQRLGAVGRLASGVAHDFNNILGIISGYAELLKMELADNKSAEESLERILTACERANSLSKKLLEFSSNRQRPEQTVDFNQVLENTREMLLEALSRSTQFEYELSDEPCLAKLELSGLENALLNLVLNAKQAMGEQGCCRIGTKVVQLSEEQAWGIGVAAGRYIALRVEDNGCGMDAETQQKIFEPFFTTKGELGTGLGLAQVYGFVKRSHGGIQVCSEVGKGTVFELYFPCLCVGARQPIIPSPKPINIKVMDKQQSRGKRILLVDDEKDMLEMMSTLLQASGYLVYRAQSASQAMAQMMTTPIDLLIADIIMPGVSGKQLSEQAMALYPQLKVMLMSGLEQESDQTELGRAAALTKPFSQKQLLEKTRALLDEQ